MRVILLTPLKLAFSRKGRRGFENTLLVPGLKEAVENRLAAYSPTISPYKSHPKNIAMEPDGLIHVVGHPAPGG